MKKVIYYITLMVLIVTLAVSTYFIATNQIENKKAGKGL